MIVESVSVQIKRDKVCFKDIGMILPTRFNKHGVEKVEPIPRFKPKVIPKSDSYFVVFYHHIIPTATA